MRTPDIQYQQTKSQYQSLAQRRQIRLLVHRSVNVDYPSGARTDEEKSRLRVEMQRTLHNPNRGVGGPLLRRQQAYANSVSMVAIRDDEAIAHLTVADNASASKRWRTEESDHTVKGIGMRIAGQAEIQAKLHIPELRDRVLIDHRFIWLGHAAMIPELHDEIAEHPEIVNPFDVMIALATDKRDERQPVVSYPWDEETAWHAELGTIGLSEQQGEDTLVYPFGDNAAPVHQERWLEESSGPVRQLILAKEGAVAAIAAARQQMVA